MSNHSCLLDLPAELRNQIFKYTLTCLEGLHVRSLADPGKPLAPRHILVASSENHRDVLHEHSEFNQLKFVNKQLHFETAHMELEYNGISSVLDFKDDKGPGSQFLAWIRTIPPPLRSWLSGANIVLSTSTAPLRPGGTVQIHIPDVVTTIRALVEFCTAHHAVILQYRLPNLCFTSPTSISDEDPQMLILKIHRNLNCRALTAEIYSRVLLGKETPQFRDLFVSRALSGTVEVVDEWKEGIELEHLLAPNFRYVSADVEDTKVLRERLAMVFGPGSRAEEIILNWAQHGL